MLAAECITTAFVAAAAVSVEFEASGSTLLCAGECIAVVSATSADVGGLLLLLLLPVWGLLRLTCSDPGREKEVPAETLDQALL